MSERFEQLIRELATELGLEDPSGLGSPLEFVIDDLPLTLAPDSRSGGDDVLIYASLGSVPAQRELEVYRAFLEGNLLWSATGDATIGVNSQTLEAILAYRVPAQGLDGAGLATLTAHFAEIATNWRDFVTAVSRQAEEAGAAIVDSAMRV